MTDIELVQAAIRAREKAYCPYSNFAVGNCAERTAIFRAVFDGQRDFTAIAIVGGPAGQPVSELCAPCGVCRQVMMEFCDPATFRILMGTGGDAFEERTLQQMLPFGFGPANLGR